MLSHSEKKRLLHLPAWTAFLLTLALIAAATALAPTEKTLGANMRLIFLHGAWVWAGLLAFLAAAVAGLAGLVARKETWHAWSLALGRAGLALWLTYLPMSLLVMRLNWGGFYFDEPRWRIPMAFAVAGTLLQVGLALFNSPRLASAGNLAFGATLWAATLNMQSILHPDSPILNSGARGIQVYFVVLLGLVLVAAWQVAGWWRGKER